MHRVVLMVVFALLASPLRAENIALLIDTRSYDTLPDLRNATGLDRAEGVLSRRGFEVVSARDLPIADLRAELAALQARLVQGDIARLVVVASGLFAASDSGSWLLGADADQPNLATADGAGLRLDTVMEIAASASDAAHLWLVEPSGVSLQNAFGPGLRAGLPERLIVPRNVAVLRGPARTVMSGLEAVLQPGTTLSEVLAATRGLRAQGNVPVLVPFLPEGFAPATQADRQAWDSARTADTEDSYRSYLSQYPNGLNAQEARQRIDALRNSPERVEQDLNLSRDERRAIQRDLTTLGFNTRGIDGLFGPGTRGAISAWQAQGDLTETGYLTRDQIFQLAGQAARRAAEIEAEERARREAAERADRAFWEGTGSGADEPGLRAYLARYPEGIFATLARERLDRIEAEARAAADRAAWSRAEAADSVEGYRAYLAEYPDGAYRSQARNRIDDLRPAPVDPEPTPDPSPGVAEAEEANLNLPLPVRLLVERRLAALGHDPGAIDGNFDFDTRDAIAQAQAEFGQPVTGYATQALLDAMLQDAFRGLFE